MMKLAAIDIGTNSIHMIIVEAVSQRNFKVIEREKAMIKLGAGVFATNRLSDRAFQTGIETIHRYVQLAEQVGVDDVITAATSAIREAQNGDAFLAELVQRTGLEPRIISGKEEARLIFLAVRNSISLMDDTALVFDIGGGSTEAVIGNRQEVLYGESLPLGVLRLLDMFEDKGPITPEGRHVVESHIQFLAQKTIDKLRDIGFDRVVGTSGTIRTLGEAALLRADQDAPRSLNAEVVPLKDLSALTANLLEKPLSDRAQVDGISDKRADAIHLGGVLLTQLLTLAGTKEITLCEASLREGMVLDYLQRHAREIAASPERGNLRDRKMAQLAQKYQCDLPRNEHVARLALALFDQTQTLHEYGGYERDLLKYAALVHDIGQFVSFRKHHKNSRYLIKRTDHRGFTSAEILLIGHLARYHCKAPPTKRHSKFKKLSKAQRQLVQVLSGMLRIAVNLDKTQNQRVVDIACDLTKHALTIGVTGVGNLDLEVWAAQRASSVLAAAFDRTVEIQHFKYAADPAIAP
ncbi:MAG: Ppx/GppA phosphatase family protein [Leptolyngbyaceae cyanobacterium]